MFRHLAVRPTERVLDVGTGTGSSAIGAARAGARVSRIDASLAMLGMARAHARGYPVTFVQADMTALPFADACFDASLIVTTLCFVSRPGTVLHEAALRPAPKRTAGGRGVEWLEHLDAGAAAARADAAADLSHGTLPQRVGCARSFCCDRTRRPIWRIP